MAKRAARVYIGFMPFMFCDRFWAIVQCEIERRVNELLPLPDRTVVVDLSHVVVTENTTQPENPTMAQDIAVSVSGDAPFGYTAEGIAFVNKAGNPADPAPNSVVVTTSDAAVCGASYLGGGKVWLQPLDSAAEGAVCTITISANETGTDDDARIAITIAADRVGSVDVANVTVTENASAPV